MSSFRDGMGGVLDLVGYVDGQYQQGVERKRKNSLAQLAGDYYSNPTQQGLANIARVDPAAASQHAQAGQQISQQQLDRARMFAGMLLKAPPGMKQQIWESQVKPGLNAIGLPVDGAYLPEYDQLAQSLAGDSSKPFSLTPGSQLVDSQGNVIHANTNFRPPTPVWDSQRNGWAIPPDVNGDAQYAPPQGGQQAPMPYQGGGDPAGAPAPSGGPSAGPSGAMPDLYAFLDQVKFFGGRPTSGYRSRAEQDALIAAGKTTTRNSQHNDSTGVDVAFPNAQAKAQAIQAARARGINFKDEGDHVHFGIPRALYQGGGQSAPQGGPPQGSSPGFISVGPPRPDFKAAQHDLAVRSADRADRSYDLAEAAARRAADLAARTPPPISTEERLRLEGEAKRNAAREEQRLATDPLVANALEFALRTTNLSEAEFVRAAGGEPGTKLADLSPDAVAKVIESRGNARWLDGPAVAEIPFMGPMVQRVTQGDTDGNAQASAAKQARIDNPSGVVTNADVLGARAALWAPERSAASNAAAIRRTLEQARRVRGNTPAAPAQPPARPPRVGEVRKGHVFLGGNPADKSAWAKVNQ